MDTLTPSNSVTDTQAVPGIEAAEQPVKKFENVAQIVSSISRPKVVTFSHLVRKLKEYLPPADIEKVLDAFRFADEMHLGQIRKSGEAYISHPLCVAEICSEWKLDAQSISAALLHDVVEDQHVSIKELVERFGPSVAQMVDGLSKLEKIQFQSWRDGQGENFRKLLIAMSKDIRVILVKLADRLHNMRTLSSMRDEKRHRISRETMEVYVPIAHRLGMNKLYRELQDLAFHHLYPFRYETLAKAVNAARKDRRPLLGQVHDAVSAALEKNGLHAELYGREKTLYSIFRKMRNKHLTFDEVLDIYGFRIVVDTIPQCYLALGVLHSIYKPMPGKFEDYIAIPKLNSYQSLHTTLIGPYGAPVEFQIRTHEMHHVAESGIAAHWLYKTGGEDLNEIQRHSLGWLQSLLDIQQQTGNATEFLEHVKVDLFPDSVYVFTPKSKIIALPRVATALDFAYSIHSEIGDHAVSAKINGMNVPLRTQLQNGDIVEIVTEPDARPHPRWLEFVRTGKARSRIRNYLRSVDTADAMQIGKRLFEQSCQKVQVNIADIPKDVLTKRLRETNAKSLEDLYSAIGTGKRIAMLIARRIAALISESGKKTTSDETQVDTQPQSNEPVVIYGSEGLSVTMAPCCKPIPGDSIIGELNETKGLVIHCEDCQTAKRLSSKEPEKWINVDWGSDLAGKRFDCQFNVQVVEEQGILARVTSEISNAEVNITAVQIEMQGPFTLFKFTIQVADRDHLASLIRRMRNVHGVKRVGRNQLTT
jgi:GTP pyrophosphokinase